MSDNNYRDIQQFALNVRKDVAKILHRTRDSHIGGGYSSIDILSVLYTRVLDISPENLDDPNRNVFILSKGHIAASHFIRFLHTRGLYRWRILKSMLSMVKTMRGIQEDMLFRELKCRLDRLDMGQMSV